MFNVVVREIEVEHELNLRRAVLTCRFGGVATIAAIAEPKDELHEAYYMLLSLLNARRIVRLKKASCTIQVTMCVDVNDRNGHEMQAVPVFLANLRLGQVESMVDG